MRLSGRLRDAKPAGQGDIASVMHVEAKSGCQQALANCRYVGIIACMDRLFEEPPSLEVPDTPEPQTPDGRVVSVAINANVWRTFDYHWPDSLGEPTQGQRVRVPFGRSNKRQPGFIADCNSSFRHAKLKTVEELIDSESQLDPVHWQLASWISQYYLTPLGMTLAAMVPSAVGKHTPKTRTFVKLLCQPADWPGQLGSKQRRVLDELYEANKQGVEMLGLEELIHHSGGSRDTVMRLKRRDLVTTETRPLRLDDVNVDAAGEQITLNDDQETALAEISSKLDGGFSSTLLYGVTGSGKTEVYIRAIQKVIDAGKQAIVLVPEIAMATQTLQRLVKRLPRVAVLHSALTDSQRAFYFEQIRDGHASVVVGPRSAVFAPARKLGLIVVDEEHEGAFKQDTAPRYHGRDVAVMLGSQAKVPVVLGSATPSLESWHNAQSGRYGRVDLPNRVRNLPMPKLEIVNLRQETASKRIELIGATLTHRLAATLDRQEQTILLMNRRGFANFVFCPSCKWEMHCDHCTRPMIFHQATQMAMCHYCNSTVALPEYCPACKGKLVLFGMGIQRVEEELGRKFPTAKVARMDSDTMTSPKQFKKVFDAFAAGELDILLGTQMVAKGLDFPRVSLVGVLSADTSLSIPDFRASERTFQLIVQVAGRAGRADLPGHVVVQTLHAEEPAIIFATEHDFRGFAEVEIALRQEASLPPFARMMRFVVKHQKSERAQDGARMLAGRLREVLGSSITSMIGPMPAGIQKIRDEFRFEILITLRRGGACQRVLYPQMEQIVRDIPADVIADVDPLNLM